MASTTKQKGVVLGIPDEPVQLRNDLPQPKPGPKQVLVKSLYVGLSHLDIEMTRPGSLRNGMPVLAGSNFSGAVIAVGNECCKLGAGDFVYGLCRIGRNRYSPFQQTFLVDEDLAFKKPDQISPQVAASIGMGVVVAALGVVMGGRMEFPKYGTSAERRDEWVVILDGNGAVGHFAIQIACLCGYKVLASCSITQVPDVLRCGANNTFNNQDTPDRQVSEVDRLTGGRIRLVFDATVMCRDVAFTAFDRKIIDMKQDKKDNLFEMESGHQSPGSELAPSNLAKGHRVSESVQPHSPRTREAVKYTTYISAVEMWSPDDHIIQTPMNAYVVRAEMLGQNGEQGSEVTADMSRLIPILETYIDKGAIIPGPCGLFNYVGWKGLIRAIDFYKECPPKITVVVQVQEP